MHLDHTSMKALDCHGVFGQWALTTTAKVGLA